MILFKGFGKSLGSYRETNAEVSSRLGITEDEIIRKIGIEQRFIAKEETAGELAKRALVEALSNSGISAEGLDGIIVSTFTADYLYPNMASWLARELNVHQLFCFDLQANCAGLQMAMVMAKGYLANRPDGTCLALVGLAKQSPFLDPMNKETAFLFSDAASAVIVEKVAGDNAGLLESSFRTNGQNYEIVRLRAGGSKFPYRPELFENDRNALYYEHAGLGVWTEVMVELPKLIRESLESVGWSAGEVGLFLFHQANLRLLEFVLERLRVPNSKTVLNVSEIGNTADASLGTVLYDAERQGKLTQPGTKVILASVGAGFVYVVTPYVVATN